MYKGRALDDDHVPGVDSMIRWLRLKRRGNYTDNSSALIVSKKHKPPRSEPLIQVPVTDIFLGKRGRTGPAGPRGNGRRHFELEAVTNLVCSKAIRNYKRSLNVIDQSSQVFAAAQRTCASSRRNTCNRTFLGQKKTTGPAGHSRDQRSTTWELGQYHCQFREPEEALTNYQEHCSSR